MVVGSHWQERTTETQGRGWVPPCLISHVVVRALSILRTRGAACFLASGPERATDVEDGHDENREYQQSLEIHALPKPPAAYLIHG